MFELRSAKTMTIVGMLRIKNEARWIERCISSILPVCDRVLVMDDHSTDGTPDLCAAIPRVHVFPSPFEGLNETRDKNWLLEQVGKPDWIIAIDGDEMLMPGCESKLVDAMKHPYYTALSFRIFYLWDRESQVRMDGVYGQFRRESAFRPDGIARFGSTSAGGNFHCGNVPFQLRHKRNVTDEVKLLHFGYMHREDRIRKHAWYNDRDPNNWGEDCYQHIVIGDLLPATHRGRHGGPLELKPLEALCRVGTAA